VDHHQLGPFRSCPNRMAGSAARTHLGGISPADSTGSCPSHSGTALADQVLPPGFTLPCLGSTLRTPCAAHAAIRRQVGEVRVAKNIIRCWMHLQRSCTRSTPRCDDHLPRSAETPVWRACRSAGWQSGIRSAGTPSGRPWRIQSRRRERNP
jgi:hypothetical protein